MTLLANVGARNVDSEVHRHDVSDYLTAADLALPVEERASFVNPESKVRSSSVRYSNVDPELRIKFPAVFVSL